MGVVRHQFVQVDAIQNPVCQQVHRGAEVGEVVHEDADDRPIPALQRQAPNNYNVGVTYDRKRLSTRFAMTHNDASIYSYFWVNNAPAGDPVTGLRGPNGDQYLYPHTQYDIQGSYRLYKGLSVVAYGLNLSNEVFGFYQGSKQYPIQREFYKTSYMFGLRYTLSNEPR